MNICRKRLVLLTVLIQRTQIMLQVTSRTNNHRLAANKHGAPGPNKCNGYDQVLQIFKHLMSFERVLRLGFLVVVDWLTY